jgi:glycosyltransferase involved in cell wall biosynthesis
MRIALVAPPWAPVPPPLYGGIEAVVHELAVGLQEVGHDVLLFATDDSECPVPTHSLLSEAEGTRIGHGEVELRHVMDAYENVEGFDIVHDHTVCGPVFAQLVSHPPVVTTMHGSLEGELGDVYRRIAPLVPTIAISATQCEAASCPPVAGVIHHGVDASRYPVGDGGRDYCLFLGRFAPEKGAHLAIAAARLAGAPLVLAGKKRAPSEEAYFARDVEPHLDAGRNIFHVGEVSHERKLELLRRARCLLFPIGWREPFGLVLLEALACGTPVIAFAKGAVTEIVDHGRTGFICRDVQEMAAAICRVDELDDGACRAAVEHHFSARRMVADHLDLYRRVVDRHRRTSGPARRIQGGPDDGRQGLVVKASTTTAAPSTA